MGNLLRKQMIPSSTSLQPELPPDTKPLQHQVAGHVFGKSKTKFGILQRCSTGDILKPIVDERGLREEQFYRDVFSEQASENLRAFRPFISKFFGTYEYGGVNYMILENIIHPFVHPCVADIKIGRITYDAGASKEKIEEYRRKFPALADIGFQLLGWQVYRPADNSYEYHDKVCGRSLTKEEMPHAIAHFYGAPLETYREIVRSVLKHPIAVEQIMAKQCDLTFIATSLLIVYEGQKSAQNESQHQERRIDVRLVDFAHVSKHEEGVETGQVDENFLSGLRNYMNDLRKVLDDTYVYVPIDKLNRSMH